MSDLLIGIAIGTIGLGGVWLVAAVYESWVYSRMDKMLDKKLESYEYRRQIGDLVKELVPLELSKIDIARREKIIKRGRA